MGKPTDDSDALLRLCQAATEERHRQLAEAFAKGPDAVLFDAMHEIALAVAGMELCRGDYTQADLELAAQTRMTNDPVFHTIVHQITGILREYVDAAKRHAASGRG